jgi:hypothetical protein
VVFLAMGAGLYLLGQQAVERIGERRIEGAAPDPVNLSDTPEILENQAPTLLNLQREGRGPSVTAREEGRPVSSVTAVHNITWSETESETVVTVWGNGAFTPTNTGYLHLDGENPREVVRILGVEGPYSPSSLEIETPHVERLRIGFHPGRHFHELHVVADLASSEVTLESFEFDRSNLVLRFTRGS